MDEIKTFKYKISRLLNTNFDRAFGMDISDNSIEIIELGRLVKFSLENYGRTELPDGIVNEGKVLNESALSEKIKTLLTQIKPGRVSTNKVVLSIPEQQVFTHYLKLSMAGQTETVKAIVEKEISNTLPVNLDKMYWDIRAKKISNGDFGVVFAGVKKEVAESYIRVCNMIGLEVIALGLEPLSIARAILENDETPTVVVDIGSKTTNISIIRGNDRLELAVSTPVGGYSMTKAIAKALNIDEKQAEIKKLELGSSTSADISSIIEPVVGEIGSEIKRTIDYYEENFKEKIDKIFLIGGASILGGVNERIAEITGRKVDVAVVFNDFEKSGLLNSNTKNEEKIVPVMYTNAIGLGMLGASNEYEDINFIKQMPRFEANEIERSTLFKAGYLNKMIAIRILFNSRISLIVSILLFFGSFGWFSYEIFNYKAISVRNTPVKTYTTSNTKLIVIPENYFPNVGTSTNATTSTSTGKIKK